jgi:hypothetical protein
MCVDILGLLQHVNDKRDGNNSKDTREFGAARSDKKCPRRTQVCYIGVGDLNGYPRIKVVRRTNDGAKLHLGFDACRRGIYAGPRLASPVVRHGEPGQVTTDHSG